MRPFGWNLTEAHFSLKHKLYLRLFGLPFSWSKPNLVLKVLAPREGELILDVGCRSGALLAEIAARGARALGLDVDEGAIGRELPQTRAYRQRIDLVVNDIRTSAIKEESCDKITMLDCLEHIADDRAALAAVHRLLKPGGIAVLTVPTIPGHPPHRLLTRLIGLLPRRMLRHAKADQLHDGAREGAVVEFGEEREDSVCVAETSHADLLKAFGHYRHYDEQTMRELCKATGFAIVTMKRFQMLFESEMMHFHHAVKGFQSIYVYPMLRIVSCLDLLLPRSYPGVGLLTVVKKEG
jgi:2-polyprenyl-3-methyl-5-hydroxy-6-metoxy-1,4-benzoquinol methylase